MSGSTIVPQPTVTSPVSEDTRRLVAQSIVDAFAALGKLPSEAQVLAAVATGQREIAACKFCEVADKLVRALVPCTLLLTGLHAHAGHASIQTCDSCTAADCRQEVSALEACSWMATFLLSCRCQTQFQQDFVCS